MTEHHPKDKGCKEATAHLGRQSRCILLDEANNIIDECPFDVCIEDIIDLTHGKKLRIARDIELKSRLESGESGNALAAEFHLTRRTVMKANRGK